MANNIKVTTVNQGLNNNGGYHELHDIKYLNSPKHALEIVKSIIDLNIQFADKDCPIVNVYIECEDIETYEFIKEYYYKYGSDDLEVSIYNGIKIN
jgi:hypothetical protein